MKHSSRHTLLAAFILLTTGVSIVHAGRIDDVLESIAKVGSKVDTTTIKSLDDLFEQALKKRNLSIPKSSADEIVALRKLARQLDVTDPSVLKVLDDIPAGQQRKIAAVLMDGAGTVKKGVPDIVARGRLLQLDEAGDILIASSRHGDVFAREASFLRKAFDAGTIKAAAGRTAGTFADFTRMMVSPKGKRYWQFWNHAGIRKHWKKLAAAGVIGWFLYDPDFFIDGAGALTERGSNAIRDLAGEVVASAFRGLFVPTPGKEWEYGLGLLSLSALGYGYLAWKRHWFPFSSTLKQEA